jgi:hypothetical protein
MPRGIIRRVFFLLLALGAVIVLKGSGSWTFGGLFGEPGAPAGAAPTYHLKVSGPPPSSAP